MSIDINDQYDKIFRYCYYKIHNRDIAEDLTQETFLRFLESLHYRDMGKELHYLYTIAGNLCKDAFHRRTAEELDENIADDKDYEDFILTNVALGNAIKNLVLGELFGMSRFRMSRRIKGILRHLRQTLD